MTRYALRRLAAALPVLFTVATLTFFLVQLTPGDPAAYLLGGSATKEQVAELHGRLGLDDPLFSQYASWLGNAVRGDFGTSVLDSQRVTDVLALALPATLSLAVLGTLFTALLGAALGLAAAVRGGRTDRLIGSLCGVAMAVPNFWLAALLILVFGFQLGAFPVTDYVPLTENPGQWLAHLVLPTAAVGLAGLGRVTFQTRAAVLDVLGREYMLTLQAAGVPRRRLLVRHVLRNAAIPVVTVTGMSFLFTLGGVVIIESLFGFVGLGSLLLRSVQGHDLPVVQGVVVVFAALVVLVNLLVDLAAAWLDPRIRIS